MTARGFCHRFMVPVQRPVRILHETELPLGAAAKQPENLHEFLHYFSPRRRSGTVGPPHHPPICLIRPNSAANNLVCFRKKLRSTTTRSRTHRPHQPHFAFRNPFSPHPFTIPFPACNPATSPKKTTSHPACKTRRSSHLEPPIPRQDPIFKTKKQTNQNPLG